MTALELFSGSQSFRKVAETLGIKTYSLDIKQVGNLKTEFVVDYMDFDITKLDFMPDFIWASPDCAAFSVAAGHTHFDAGCIEPKTEKARKSIEVVKKLHTDILYMTKLNPNLIFWIENPVGKMAWLPFMKEGLFQLINNFRVVRIDQCAYGRKYKKATHIFTNDLNFNGKMCNGSKCAHARNNDGRSAWMKKEGQGKGNDPFSCTGYWQRAMLPPNLIQEILKPYAK